MQHVLLLRRLFLVPWDWTALTPKPFHHGLLPYRFGNLRDAIWRWKRQSVCGHSTAKTETKRGTNSRSNPANNMANSGVFTERMLPSLRLIRDRKGSGAPPYWSLMIPTRH